MAAATVTWLLPRWLGYALMDAAGSLGYLLLGRYRRAVLDNLGRVMGRPPHDRLVRRAARRCFQTSARNFWDLCSLPHTRPGRLMQRIEMAPGAWAVLQGAVRRGRGVVIVTSHLGAFDYAGQIINLLGTPPLIPTAQTTSGRIFHAVTWLRRSWGAIIEPPSPGLLRQMLTYLRRGGLVGILGDRDINHTGLPVVFFGAPTTLPAGPIRLAVETGAAVVALFCPRAGDRYRLFVEEVPVQRTGDRERDMAQSVDNLAAVLERHIGAWPEQWVIFERVWPAGGRVPRRRRPAVRLAGASG